MTKKKPFHNPFQGIKLPPKPAPEAAPKAAPAAREVPPLRPSRSHEGLTDDDLWQMATEGADPLQDRSQKIRPTPAPISVARAELDPELEAYDELRGLLGGEVPFDLADGDEFIEGSAHGLDARILKRLRRGDYSVQGHLDLHGMNREEAKAALEAFIAKSRTAGKRCVLVVHGRGLHSKDQVPVLKEQLLRWMATARFAQSVLAFASARPGDGGVGAVYLLLKKL